MMGLPESSNTTFGFKKVILNQLLMKTIAFSFYLHFSAETNDINASPKVRRKVSVIIRHRFQYNVDYSIAVFKQILSLKNVLVIYNTATLGRSNFIHKSE